MPITPVPYDGEDLGPSPHVAVIFRDQIGDFLVATPLMRGLRERFPGIVLDYFGGERTRELEETSDLVDARCSLYGGDDVAAFIRRRIATAGPYDLAVNLEADRRAALACGLLGSTYAVGRWADGTGTVHLIHAGGTIDGLWADLRWNRADLLSDYPELGSQFIGEIFCRLARVETDYFRTETPVRDPSVSVPSVLLSTGANRSAKLWPTPHWLTLAAFLREEGWSAGLLGAAPKPGDPYHADQADDALIETGVRDLRGRLTLPEVAGALRGCHGFVTVDNGLMHLAAAVGAPTAAIFGASPQRLWTPRSPAVRVVEPSDPCPSCEDNRFRNADCLLPIHQCMLSVEPDRVIRELRRLLSGRCMP